MHESEYARLNAPPLPQARREFRAAWVATVSNIDWPSRSGLPTAQQKKDLLAILDKLKALNMNAVILQVRPNCDALYESPIEPWSAYLTGQQGKAPSPYYDPLSFAVEEAHKRGMELHAWFNPYRATHPATRTMAPNHVSKTHPNIVRKVGRYLWLDPAEKETQDYTLEVILDVVRRYDIDGVHIDDYFYPYPEYLDGAEFPDEKGYGEYKKSGGTLIRGDWRRHHVDQFVERMYQAVKAEKAWVKVGISPFGIWKPGHPEGVQGFDQHNQLYADAKLWINKGWVDYWTPQLYWAIESQQPYKRLLKWWVEQNSLNRHVWPGLGAHHLTDSYGWSPTELIHQIEATRNQAGATGNVYFSMKLFMQDAKGVNGQLVKGPYGSPALIPASPWLDSTPPSAPSVTVRPDETTGGEILTLASPKEKPFFWVLYSLQDGKWDFKVVPVTFSEVGVAPDGMGRLPHFIAVSALDRAWNESSRVVVRLVEEQE